MEETIVMEELLDNEILGKEFVDEYNLVICEKIAKKLMQLCINSTVYKIISQHLKTWRVNTDSLRVGLSWVNS